MGDVHYRPAEKGDLQAVLDLTMVREENVFFLASIYSTAVVKSIYKMTRGHPEGFIVAEKDGRVIGVTVVNILDEETCFGGLSVVAKLHRGEGVGRGLFKMRLEVIGDRNFGVDASAIGVSVKRGNGFNIVGTKRLMYVGFFDTSKLHSSTDQELEVIELTDADSEALIKYDEYIHVKPRGHLNIIDGYLKLDGVIAKVVMKRGTIVGFGALDTTHEKYYRIGPLYADSMDAARCLLLSLLRTVRDDKPQMILVAGGNKDVMSIVEENSSTLKLIDTSYSMFSLRDVAVPIGNIYALTNFTTYII